MATKTQMTVEQYLRTSFPDLDCEFVDGEVVERTMPPYEHAFIQGRLIVLFSRWTSSHGLLPLPELRSKVRQSRVRIPDVAVYIGRPNASVPDQPPLVAIEILSPDDRMVNVMEKLREYRTWGVGYIWVIDPMARILYEMTTNGLREMESYDIPAYDVKISSNDLFEGI
jgi:Uma2 family endonuclease